MNITPSAVRVGGKYRFEKINPRPAINTGRIGPMEHFVEVIGFSTWPNGQRAILVKEWQDGYELPADHGIPAISDMAHHWRVTEIEPPR